MRALGCNSGAILGNDKLQNMELVAKVGFTKTFITWDDGVDMAPYLRCAKDCGIEIETLHSPFGKMNTLWDENDPEGDLYTEKLRRCIWAAADGGVPYVIMHTTIGNTAPLTSNIGLVRFGKLVREAEKTGVKLAFENLEFIRHLALLLDTFDSPNVGFCYDLGHEHCYTPGLRMMPLFGKRLFCTHIHDNLGMGREKNVSYRDDLHRIPFEGNVDFARDCREIAASGFTGTLMLELDNRKDYGFYNGMEPLAFYRKAYAAAERLRDMTDGKKE